MVDIETLGTRKDSVIIAIGAVDMKTGDTFYTNVDPQSCVDIGLKVDVSTVMWWMKQGDEAREAVTRNDGTTITEALMLFGEFIDPCGPVTEMWGNGSDFDNVILGEAYRLCGIKQPWSYGKNRCFRTVRGLFPNMEPTRGGTHHNALDDAKHQAQWLMAIRAMVGI